MTVAFLQGLAPINGKKWKAKNSPNKILVIRLQAFGDVVITLPYIQSLKNTLPANTQIDFLTRTRMCDLPVALTMFRKVYILKGGNNVKWEFIWFLTMLPRLFLNRYDVIIDLQNHRFSKIIRKTVGAKSWVEFDRDSKMYAGLRTKRTIDFLGLGEVEFSFPLILKSDFHSDLSRFHLPNDADFIVLNPAGFFETRNWPKENYLRFCALWMSIEKRKTYFIMLGESTINQKASYYEQNLGNRFINLAGKTTAPEALQLLSNCKLVVSEDSGLFHMACTSGVPVIGIYGSTRNDWTNPMLPHSYCFNSSDLECGDCMRETCLFETVKCLTRVLPEHVLEKAMYLLNSQQKNHSHES